MRIGLFTWGSEGDVRPFVALGSALVKRGHRVSLGYVLINGTDLDPLCASHGIDARFVAKQTIADAFVRPGPHQEVLCGKGSPLKQVQSVLAGLLDPVAEEMFQDAREHMPQYDVAVVHLLHHPAASVATKLGVPLAYVLTAPTLPTREMAPIGVPNCGTLNPLVWRSAELLAGHWFLPRVNALRTRLDLPRLTRMYPKPNPEIALGMTCVSPTLFSRPRDWPDNQQVPGFFDLPLAPSTTPHAIDAFLDAGEAPVLMTFGSMLARVAPETDACLQAMFEAAEHLDGRTIIQVPEHARGNFRTTSKVFVAGDLPHASVMPRCSLVVHHGGAGTTQAATLAGRPSVVVPFMADQFFWAERLRRVGASAAAVPRLRLSGGRLRAAISQSLNHPELASRAALAGQAMKGEDGVGVACRLIEQLST